MLDPQYLFPTLEGFAFIPQIDLFASRINKQFAQYVSYRPDPFASYIHAFTITLADKQFYCFPPFKLYTQSNKKNNMRQRQGSPGSTTIANTDMVSHVTTDIGATTSCPSTSWRPVGDATQTRADPPTSQEVKDSYLSCIRGKLQVKGFSSDTIDIILSSWRDDTQTQYQAVAKKWFGLCEKHNCDATLFLCL
jgi:hypothetical protein